MIFVACALLMFVPSCTPDDSPKHVDIEWPSRDFAISQIAAVNSSIDQNFPNNGRLAPDGLQKVYQKGFDYLLGKPLNEFPGIKSEVIRLTPEQCITYDKAYGGVDLESAFAPGVNYYFILTNLWGLHESWDVMDTLLLKTENGIVSEWSLSDVCEY